MTRQSTSQHPQRRTAAVSLWSLAGSIALLSIGLGLAHAIPAHTPAIVSCLIATSLLALNAAGLWLCRDDLDRLPRHSLPAVGLAAAIGPVLAGFAGNPAGAVFPIVWCALLLLASVSTAIVWPALRDEPAADASGEAPPQAESNVPCLEVSTAMPPVEQAPLPKAAAQDALSPPDDPTISLQLTRRLVGLDETIEIAARLSFLPGERQVSVHLPISPPLPSVPQVECEPVDAADIELTVGAVYPYGVRIDARRPLPADAPLAATVAVLLTATRTDRAAA